MARIIVSPQAEHDLAQIVDEISDTAGPAVAGNLLGRIVAVIDKLALVPNASGRLVPALGKEIRCHAIGSYNVYLRYDEAADVLLVVRVLHGRRNITAALFEK
ncbi:MAG: type II toxin-antitoxin system RelE/ParE family toxin [Hyphomonadaceae bacterium]|jgi:plasmid stabilization system protein ParE|nr:type II toxin-antitoxin system RelE/ParE family toxin [Hyphomonadaceae bacterium]